MWDSPNVINNCSTMWGWQTFPAIQIVILGMVYIPTVHQPLGSAVLVISGYIYIYTVYAVTSSWRFISMIIPSYIHKVTSTVPPRPLGASTCHGRPSCLCRSCGACGVFRACGRQTNKRGRAWKMAWVAGLKRWIFKW